MTGHTVWQPSEAVVPQVQEPQVWQVVEHGLREGGQVEATHVQTLSTSRDLEL